MEPGPPLYDPERRILVVYDLRNGGVVAMRYAGPGKLAPLWRNDFENTVVECDDEHTSLGNYADGQVEGPVPR